MAIFPNERERYSQALARASHRNYLLYLALSESETESTAKHVFLELAEVAKAEFHFWGTKGVVRADTASLWRGSIFFYKILRKLLGSDVLIYLLLCGEDARLALFTKYCVECIDAEEQKIIHILLERSASFVKIVDQKKLNFLRHIFLQSGEILVFMSAALIGFSLIFQSPLKVAMAGSVIVIARTLARAAAAYFHADHMANKGAHSGTFLSGSISFVGGMALVLPFLLSGSMSVSIIAMVFLVLFFACLISLCGSVLLQKKFSTQLFQILILLLSAWIVAFFVGLLANVGFPQ